MSKTPTEMEDDRITALALARALHTDTILALRHSVQTRLRNPAYQLPAQRSDRAAIINARTNRAARYRRIEAEAVESVGDLPSLHDILTAA